MRYLHSVASAGVIALAATASPAIAAVTFETFIPVPADAANVQPGGAFSSFDISFADPVTGNIFIADRSNASCRYLFGIQPDISRPGDRVYRAAGDNIDFRRGWRFDGHLGRGHNPLRR